MNSGDGIRNLQSMARTTSRMPLVVVVALACGIVSCTEGSKAADQRETALDPPPLAIVVDAAPSFSEQGKQLYSQYCVACHGAEGRGGVANPNYLNPTIPALDLIAERLGVDEPEDMQIASRLLTQGADLKALGAEPPFRAFPLFVAQYEAIQKVIEVGNPGGKKDPLGPEPIAMPPWGSVLQRRQVDSIIVYLLTVLPDEE